MAASKLPSFQFYPGDWLRDSALRAVSLAARGLWMDLLCLMWDSPSRGVLATAPRRPYSVEQIARMAGCSTDEAGALLEELKSVGVCSTRKDGAIYSRRMVRDERERIAGRLRVAEHRRKSNPINKTVTGGVTQMYTPSSSSSSSSSSEEEKEEKRVTNAPPVGPPKPPTLEDEFEQIWAAYPSKGRTRRPLSEQNFIAALEGSNGSRAELVAQILVPLLPGGKWAESEQWHKGFVFSLADYLAQKRWLEDPNPAKKPDDWMEGL